MLVAEEKRPLRRWEGAVEKQIREAIERGDFRNLSGRGRRLNLEDNPFTPAEWQMAYRLLQDAGVAPEWIEQDKAIRRERQALAELLAQHLKWEGRRRASLGSLAPDRLIAEYEDLNRSRERVCERFRERATTLNGLIDAFNLQAPSSRLHHSRIRIESELERFLNECRRKG